MEEDRILEIGVFLLPVNPVCLPGWVNVIDMRDSLLRAERKSSMQYKTCRALQMFLLSPPSAVSTLSTCDSSWKAVMLKAAWAASAQSRAELYPAGSAGGLCFPSRCLLLLCRGEAPTSACCVFMNASNQL